MIVDKFLVLWNMWRLRRCGVQFGPGLRLRGHVGLNIRGKVSIGRNFVCSSGNMSNAMGRNVRSFIRVIPGATLTIGDNTGMSSATLWCANSITIGSNVKIGALTIVTDTDAHSLDPELRRNPATDAANARTAPVVIGDDVFIGTSCIICKGVTIGPRSIIAAGSVLSHSVGADELWGGNPARFIKKINQ